MDVVSNLQHLPLREQVYEYLEHLEVERNLSPLTIRDYTLYLQRFMDWAAKYGVTRAQDITSENLRKFRLSLTRLRNQQDEPITVRTQAYYLIALRSFLKWMVKQDVAVMAPEKIDLPKAEPHEMTVITPEAMARLLETPDVSTLIGLRDRAILEVLFSTGLRVSELVSLDRTQIDTQRREFGVVGKGRKQRVVFLSPEAAAWMERYFSARGDQFVPAFIRHAKGVEAEEHGEAMRLTSRSVQRLVEKYRQLAKIPVLLTPHGIRHSFATDLLRNGAGLRDVQEMLGHKNIATTQIYTHVTQPELRKVHERFHAQKPESDEN